VCFDAVAPVIPSEKALEIGYLAEAKSYHQEISEEKFFSRRWLSIKWGPRPNTHAPERS
jgi:hypothetical protein